MEGEGDSGVESSWSSIRVSSEALIAVTTDIDERMALSVFRRYAALSARTCLTISTKHGMKSNGIHVNIKYRYIPYSQFNLKSCSIRCSFYWF